jgi:hypothetical protein
MAMMLSAWWILAALMLGGCLGMLISALMTMSASEADRAEKAEQAALRGVVGSGSLGAHWS